MTTVTITIADGPEGVVNMEGRVDNPDVANQVPTGALIVGSYIAANAETICRAAIKWFRDEIPAGGDEQ